jgi:hypothetical protein
VVYRRDAGRCRFVDAQGRRCPERYRLEFHHRHPYGLGGATDAANICLMCWTHNRYLAELDYGKEKMDRYGGSREKSTVATKSGGSSNASRCSEPLSPIPEEVRER